MMLRRILFLAIALGMTLVIFEFWGRFGAAMTNVFASKPAVSNEVTMQIISAPAKQPVCGKDHPCPPKS